MQIANLIPRHQPLILLCDTQGYIVEANERAQAADMTAGTLLQSSLHDVISKRTWIQVMAESNSLKSPLNDAVFSLVLRRGQYGFSAECRIVDDATGRAILVLGVQEFSQPDSIAAASPTTGLKKYVYDARLLEGKNKIVLALDHRGTYIFCSRSVETLLGHSLVRACMRQFD
jgi:hypothetical protein